MSCEGRIDASEIQQSLAELGIDLSREDALKILQRFDPHPPLTHTHSSFIWTTFINNTL